MTILQWQRDGLTIVRCHDGFVPLGTTASESLAIGPAMDCIAETPASKLNQPVSGPLGHLSVRRTLETLCSTTALHRKVGLAGLTNSAAYLHPRDPEAAGRALCNCGWIMVVQS